MNITIRDTIESDLPFIFRIINDPLVLPHQYPKTERDTPDEWRKWLFGGAGNSHYYIKSTTVLNDSQIVAYVFRYYFQIDKILICKCGFDLAPHVWGRGIMASALSQLFDDLFTKQNVNYVLCDSFRDNQRCIRLLEKLNFRPIPISPWNRIKTAYYTKCLRWIRRFQLTPTDWKNRVAVAPKVG